MGESTEIPRVKFSCESTGYFTRGDNGNDDHLEGLSKLQQHLEDLGLIPVLDDGRVAGNCSHTSGSNTMFITKSGRLPSCPITCNDFVQVQDFDRSTWHCTYKLQHGSNSASPSSDTPLHWASLIQGASHSTKNWTRMPHVAIHGHALATGVGLELAVREGFAVSKTATLFSTPEDLRELELLYADNPYPEHTIFIRVGHGFLILAHDVEEASALVKNKIEPLIHEIHCTGQHGSDLEAAGHKH